MGFLLDRFWLLFRVDGPQPRPTPASLERLPLRDFQDLNLPEELRSRIIARQLRDRGMGRW